MIAEELKKKKTLYACRYVENAEDIIEWAKKVGFSSTLSPDDMHVTIAYSKAKVDWDEIGDPLDDEIEIEDGERSVQQFDKGAVVLKIESEELQDRWQTMLDAGCSWDYPDYKPHITISYDGAAGLDIDSLEPYDGPIILGKERFKKIDPNWKSQMKEKITEVSTLDIDFAISALILEAELEEEVLSQPGKFWFHPGSGKRFDCDDHGDFVALQHRRLGISIHDVVKIIDADGDEVLSEIERDELCDLALKEGWVQGDGDYLCADRLGDLRLATAYMADLLPGQSLVLSHHDRWTHELSPEEVTAFVEHNLLPEALAESTTNRLPRRFWLVFDLPTMRDDYAEVLQGVARGEMVGIKGISGNREIVTEFFHVARNAALVMDSNSVAARNDLERIDYFDADYLLHNGMRVLYRIWDKRFDEHGHHGFMQNLISYVQRFLRNINYGMAQQMDYYGFPDRVARLYKTEMLGENPPRINSLKDCCEHVYRLILGVAAEGGSFREHLKKSFELLKAEEVAQATAEAVRFVGRLYSEEGEWIVKNPVFIVPEGSVLMLAVDQTAVNSLGDYRKDPSKFMNKWRYERIEKILGWIKEYKLDERYTIRFIDEMKFSSVRDQTVSRRRNRKD